MYLQLGSQSRRLFTLIIIDGSLHKTPNLPWLDTATKYTVFVGTVVTTGGAVVVVAINIRTKTGPPSLSDSLNRFQ